MNEEFKSWAENLLYGKQCPRCDSRMSIISNEYEECPKCGKRIKRK